MKSFSELLDETLDLDEGEVIGTFNNLGQASDALGKRVKWRTTKKTGSKTIFVGASGGKIAQFDPTSGAATIF